MSAPEARSVVIEREIPYPPERIWRALTQGELLNEWLMENDFQPIVGHKFTFRSTPRPNITVVIECEVLVVEPNARLSYTWTAFGLKSVVEWTLTPSSAKNSTLLRMEQSGFRGDQEAAYQGAKHGWQKYIAELDRLVGNLP